MEKVNLGFELPVVFLREKKRFIAYSPVLDLSTSGKTLAEAQKRFVEIAVIFFKEIIKKRTLDEVLGELGWEKTKKEWKPPTVVSYRPETVNVPVNI